MNIVVIAEESAGIQLVKTLAATSHRIVSVLTSTSPQNRLADVAAVARGLGLEVVPAERVKDPALADDFRAAHVDLILNAHSLYLIHETVLDAPTIGAFNLHPGPLPRYAGLNAPSWAIYHGECAHGVTVHRMAARIDAGAIAYQKLFEISDDDTGFTLSAKCIRAGVPLMLRLVDTAAADPRAIPAIRQDLSQRRYFGREVPRNGAIAWCDSARAVLAFVRAFDYHPFRSPWGHPHAMYGDVRVGIVKAMRTGAPTAAPPGTVRVRPSGVEVATADEWIGLSLIHVDGRYPRPGDVLADGARLADGAPGSTRLVRS